MAFQSGIFYRRTEKSRLFQVIVLQNTFTGKLLQVVQLPRLFSHILTEHRMGNIDESL